MILRQIQAGKPFHPGKTDHQRGTHCNTPREARHEEQGARRYEGGPAQCAEGPGGEGGQEAG